MLKKNVAKATRKTGNGADVLYPSHHVHFDGSPINQVSECSPILLPASTAAFLWPQSNWPSLFPLLGMDQPSHVQTNNEKKRRDETSPTICKDCRGWGGRKPWISSQRCAY